MFHLAATKSRYSFFVFVAAAASLFFTSCKVIKNYPVNRPFVYETNIKIEGKYSTEERKVLEGQLTQQLHDSVRIRTQRKVLFWLVQNKPAVYDTLNVGKSKVFMSALLNSLGYYRDSVDFSHTIDTVGDQQRVTIDFSVAPGQLFRFDSIWYNLLDSVPPNPDIDTLQQLTMASLGESRLKKGEAFSKSVISSELDRLSDLYRNNGYLRFSKEQLLAVWDTIGRNLIRPAFTPEEIGRQLEELQRRRENPIADVQIRLKPQPDTQRLRRYYVGNIKVFPDYNIDTALYARKSESFARSGLEFITYKGLFKSRRLIRFVYLRKDSLYRQSDYLRTLNKFNSLGAWRLVTINQLPRANQDTVDFDVMLTPAQKYTIRTSFETSRNPAVLSEGNLIGLGLTLGLVNRNFARAANQATSNIRYGVELGSGVNNIQSQQFTVSHTIQFPRQIPANIPFPLLGNRRNTREDTRTSLAFNLGSISRMDYFDVKSVNASWGYEAARKNKLWIFRWPNIEYNFLKIGPRLKELIAINPSYRYIFNDGLIVSFVGGLTIPKSKRKIVSIQRYGLEVSGFPGLPGKFFRDTLYRFVKLDAEFTQTRQWRTKTSFAWRALGGLGWELPSEKFTKDRYLPFFRQYYSGGPNSMRAWSIRKLGPGSTNKPFGNSGIPDRFGDIRLELNGEIRQHLTQLFGFPLETALFIDMGNVWFLRKNADFPDGHFRFSKLWHDLAIGVGTGLRWDFGFLKLRIDAAYKAKDPSTEDVAGENVWFYKARLRFGDQGDKRGAQVQLGINYPF